MRYIPHTSEEIQDMLSTIGLEKKEDLFRSIPDHLRLKGDLNMPKGLAEQDLREHMQALADMNINTTEAKSFIGGGAYHHYVPSMIEPILKRGEFLTAYTPYQAEVSQGTLQALFEYQTMVAELTGMEVANASLYDLSTACAEAILMGSRVNRKKKVLMCASLHPHYKQVIRTYLKNLDFQIVEVPQTEEGTLDKEFLKANLDDTVSSFLVQSPNFFGLIEDLEEVATWLKEKNVFFIHANPDALSYAVLKTPGELGADVAISEGMSFGLGLNFGGPYLGTFATKTKYIRQMPGRIAGETTDEDGKRGYVLTFSTREQHIRREKATSNICTNQGLMTLAATLYLSLMGPEGLEKLALVNMERRAYLEQSITRLKPNAIKYKGHKFHEVVVKLKVPVMEAVIDLMKDGLFPGLDLGSYYPELKQHLLICTTEMNTKMDIDILVEKLNQYIAA